MECTASPCDYELSAQLSRSEICDWNHTDIDNAPRQSLELCFGEASVITHRAMVPGIRCAFDLWIVGLCFIAAFVFGVLDFCVNIWISLLFLKTKCFPIQIYV